MENEKSKLRARKNDIGDVVLYEAECPSCGIVISLLPASRFIKGLVRITCTSRPPCSDTQRFGKIGTDIYVVNGYYRDCTFMREKYENRPDETGEELQEINRQAGILVKYLKKQMGADNV